MVLSLLACLVMPLSVVDSGAEGILTRISACDGQTDIDWAALTDEQQGKYVRWEQGGFIRRAGKGKQLRPDPGTRGTVLRYPFPDRPGM